MPGNDNRRGAVRRRRGGNPTAGSGGRVRRGLKGKGPTPKAQDRVSHPAKKRADAAKGGPAKGGPAKGGPAKGGPANGRSTKGGPGKGGPAKRGAGKGGPAPAGKSSGGRPTRDRREGPEWIAGRNAVVEALRAGVPVLRLQVAERIDRDDRVREALRLASDRELPMLEVPRAELDRLTSGTVHQGLAICVPAYTYAHPDDLLERAAARDEAPLLVALDGVTDPRNLGAVIRSGAAFGAHGVVVPERRAASMTAAAWKASAGAAVRVPVARAVNLTRALRGYRDAGLRVVGLDASGTSSVDAVAEPGEPIVLVAGAEGKGLSRLVGEACDTVARIPMRADAESLNAGVAAGIALYEIARSRRQR